MAAISTEPQIVSRLHQKAGVKKIPLSGTFELSPLCNMSCKMCYIKMTAEEQKAKDWLRSKEDWLQLAREAMQEGMLFLLLTGGEPFFWPDFRELYENLHEMGLCISINSNGTLIDETVVNWLKKYPPVRINITLYGASDETYERMCGKKDGFSKVKKAITLLQEAGITVKLNCSLTPYNEKDLAKMVAFADQRGLILEVATYMFPPVRKDENMTGYNKRFTPEDTAKNTIRAGILQNGEDTFHQFLLNNQFPVLERRECSDIEGDVMRCRAGRSTFWVSWDFKLLACGMMTTPQEDLQLGKFKDTWMRLTESVEAIRLSAECQECPVKERCQTCAAMALAETGAFDGKPEYRCKMMDTYIGLCNELKDNFDIWKGIL